MTRAAATFIFLVAAAASAARGESVQPKLHRDKIPAPFELLNRKAEGFRGIWYYNQPSGDEYVYKYSGGMGTYCAGHVPMAIYWDSVKLVFPWLLLAAYCTVLIFMPLSMKVSGMDRLSDDPPKH